MLLKVREIPGRERYGDAGLVGLGRIENTTLVAGLDGTTFHQARNGDTPSTEESAKMRVCLIPTNCTQLTMRAQSCVGPCTKNVLEH